MRDLEYWHEKEWIQGCGSSKPSKKLFFFLLWQKYISTLKEICLRSIQWRKGDDQGKTETCKWKEKRHKDLTDTDAVFVQCQHKGVLTII